MYKYCKEEMISFESKRSEKAKEKFNKMRDGA
jgi:hypothetical protein